MDYGKLVGKQLTKVFQKTASLQTDAEFLLKENESFDFSTGKSVVGSVVPVQRRVLVIETVTKKEVVHKKLLMQRIEGLDAYDAVTIQGQKWQLGAVIVDDQYTQMIEVTLG